MRANMVTGLAVFEGEWARKVSSFQSGSAAGGDGDLEMLEHAALMAGPKYRCFVPAFKGVQASLQWQVRRRRESSSRVAARWLWLAASRSCRISSGRR